MAIPKKPKKLQEYIEDKLLYFCKTCSGGRVPDKITRARKMAKTMSTYIKTRWKIYEGG